MLRTLIADDEPLGRLAVRRLLESAPDIEIVGEAADGESALRLIELERVDVAFLDIRMPGLSGLDLARRIPREGPLVVFVTAHDEHAVEAFEHAAIDYLVKPIDPDRFQRTLARVRERVESKERGDLSRLLDSAAGLGPPRKITLKTSGRTIFLDPSDLVCAEAQGNYVKLRLSTGELQLRITLAELDARFQDSDVVRVHRAYLVGLRHVQELLTTDGAHGAALLLRDGSTIPVGRTYRAGVKRRLSP